MENNTRYHCVYCKYRIVDFRKTKDWKNRKIHKQCWEKFVAKAPIPYPFRYSRLTGDQLPTYDDDYKKWNKRYVEYLTNDI